MPVWIAWLGIALLSAARPTAEPDARALVETAIQRMGGRPALEKLATLRLESVGYRNLLEQSERPEGPWIPQIEKTTEIWDTPRGRWAETTAAAVADDEYTLRTIVADGAAARQYGETWLPTGRGTILEAREWMALSPHQILVSALGAGDLRREPDVVFQGVPQYVVSFGAGEEKRRLLVNAQTGFLTAVETMRAYPDDLYWQVWGDVLTRVSYSYWDLKPGGWFYPMQWDIERGGRPWRALTIRKLEPGFAPPGDAFSIPDAPKEAFAKADRPLDELPLGNPKRPAVELAPDVVVIPGSWGVGLVRQTDGIVVLEAPISNGYSARVIDEAKRRFPGVPVKAVVTTSDSWPHFGGIREYVARGIPIYLLDFNVPQIRRALDGPHRSHPDALATAPRDAVLRPVSAKTVVGQGPNRIELYPFRGETGERMMMAYLPGPGILYASDLYQSGRNGPPEYAWEVADAVRREKLEVKTVFAMHSDPAPWQSLLDLVEKATKVP
jgi:hypothetical protein